MSENDKETLEAMKVLAKSRFPQDENVINAIQTNEEMHEFLEQKKESEDEIDDETSKEGKKLVVEHLHKIIEGKKPKDDDLEGGEDLSKTGGSIPLTPEEMGKTTSYDPTEISQSGSGKQIISSIMGEIDRLEYMQATKGLKPEEAKRYKVLRAKEEQLLHSMWLGYKARGSIGKRGSFWKCPQCGNECINTNRCEICGYIVNSKIDPNIKRKWQILKGE